jgi:hypothetical protein
MRAPFWELMICELVNLKWSAYGFDRVMRGREKGKESQGNGNTYRIFVTLLLLLPPTEPIDIPCPPEQYKFDTVILFPLVMATQSSWFKMVLSVTRKLLEVEISKPSELCAAGKPLLIAFGASPALLLRTMLVITTFEQLEIEKQCVG